MANVRIKYVNKSGSTHEHITHLGNDEGTWRVEDVIRWIETGANSFYTHEQGHTAEIRVRDGRSRKYVQTVADGYWTDNLLALPRCVVAAA